MIRRHERERLRLNVNLSSSNSHDKEILLTLGGRKQKLCVWHHLSIVDVLRVSHAGQHQTKKGCSALSNLQEQFRKESLKVWSTYKRCVRELYAKYKAASA